MLYICAISDSIGETANQVSLVISSQFKDMVTIKRYPYIDTLEKVDYVIKEIKECNKVIIVSTIIKKEVGEYLREKALDNNVDFFNVIRSIVDSAAKLLECEPNYIPGAVRRIDESYFKRIEAMEFAIQYDDSKDYRGLRNADVVLIGLSRTSKTPLCMYLANKGVKAINIPLMPEVGVPDEIYEIDRKKIFGLTIDPMQLIEIRKRRLDKFHRLSTNIEYAGDARILQELEFADKIMRKIGCKTIDVTRRAIEDTALIILSEIGYNK